MRIKIISAKKAVCFDDADFSDDDVIEIVEDDDGKLSYRIFPEEYIGNAIPAVYPYEDVKDGVTFEELIEEEV